MKQPSRTQELCHEKAVEVAVLGSPSLTVLVMVSVDVEATELQLVKQRSRAQLCHVKVEGRKATLNETKTVTIQSLGAVQKSVNRLGGRPAGLPSPY